MSRDNLRNISRTNYTISADDPSIEQISLGALQRIADAVELMSKNYVDLQNRLEYYKNLSNNHGHSIDELRRVISSQKGVITKLRKRLAASLAKNETNG